VSLHINRYSVPPSLLGRQVEVPHRPASAHRHPRSGARDVARAPAAARPSRP